MYLRIIEWLEVQKTFFSSKETLKEPPFLTPIFSFLDFKTEVNKGNKRQRKGRSIVLLNTIFAIVVRMLEIEECLIRIHGYL